MKVNDMMAQRRIPDDLYTRRKDRNDLTITFS